MLGPICSSASNERLISYHIGIGNCFLSFDDLSATNLKVPCVVREESVILDPIAISFPFAIELLGNWCRS